MKKLWLHRKCPPLQGRAHYRLSRMMEAGRMNQNPYGNPRTGSHQYCFVPNSVGYNVPRNRGLSIQCTGKRLLLYRKTAALILGCRPLTVHASARGRLATAVGKKFAVESFFFSTAIYYCFLLSVSLDCLYPLRQSTIQLHLMPHLNGGLLMHQQTIPLARAAFKNPISICCVVKSTNAYKLSTAVELPALAP